MRTNAPGEKLKAKSKMRDATLLSGPLFGCLDVWMFGLVLAKQSRAKENPVDTRNDREIRQRQTGSIRCRLARPITANKQVHK